MISPRGVLFQIKFILDRIVPEDDESSLELAISVHVKVKDHFMRVQKKIGLTRDCREGGPLLFRRTLPLEKEGKMC